MKTTTKFAIGSVAVVALSAGVAGVTAYAMMEKNQDNTSFYESFETASPLRTAAFECFQHAAGRLDQSGREYVEFRRTYHVYPAQQDTDYSGTTGYF